MGYASGKLNKRVTVLRRERNTDGAFGRGSSGERYVPVATLWASVDWTRGVKAMREGALDAYDTVMVRLRWTPLLTRDCRIGHDGRVYQIESFHEDKQANVIQLTALELPAAER